MREIKDAHDLAKVWSDGSLINEDANKMIIIITIILMINGSKR